MTTNPPLSERTAVIPSARLCKALLDRITDRAHFAENGMDSYRYDVLGDQGLGDHKDRPYADVPRRSI